MYSLCVVRAARNKDNSWPEEIIAVMKEVRAKDKENKDKHEDNKSSGECFSSKWEQVHRAWPEDDFYTCFRGGRMENLR